jgi:UDP-N-acetyl-D-mannosaminuronate dehydrogenase
MIAIIGLGEIGSSVLKVLSEKSRNNAKEIIGVEVDEQKRSQLHKLGYTVQSSIPAGVEVYIICVYSTEQVRVVVKEILSLNTDSQKKPLIIIESTIKPGTIKEFSNANADIVLFPHRYNPNDGEHSVCNQKRVLGAFSREAEKRAVEFYNQFMDPKFLEIFPIEIVELAKPFENAYRYLEIAFAEEMKLLCEKQGISFKDLRSAANTKWNIDIKEAREGIGGKCLTKDCKLVQETLLSKLLHLAQEIDEEYQNKQSRN